MFANTFCLMLYFLSLARVSYKYMFSHKVFSHNSQFAISNFSKEIGQSDMFHICTYRVGGNDHHKHGIYLYRSVGRICILFVQPGLHLWNTLMKNEEVN